MIPTILTFEQVTVESLDSVSDVRVICLTDWSISEHKVTISDLVYILWPVNIVCC